MKVREFIEYMGKNVNSTMKDKQIVGLAKKQLDIKKYLPINEKKKLVDKIIYHSAYFENGVTRISNIDCYMYFTVFTIDAYTNLEIDDVEEAYDALSASDMLSVIIGAIGSEYNEVNTFLSMKRDEILEDVSMETQIAEFINYVTEKVDAFEAVITDSVKDLDVQNLINMFTQYE